MADPSLNGEPMRGMPERLGSCRIVGLLARGGFGWIYRGVQEPSGREVAVKVLPREFGDETETSARFHREAQSAARLDHPNIIKIYETGADGGYHYIAMELIDGPNLERYAEARGGTLEEGEAARLILQAAEGLGYAHMRGVFHRDVKPSNLLVTPQGKLKIVDFGLAVIYDISTRLTQTGLCVGTPYFMSPERCQGFRGDARSDIYSLGVTLYVLTTGKMPFDFREIADILRAHVRAPRPDPWTLNPNLSPAMRNIILRCMAKRPEDRPQSALELARDLKPLAKTGTISEASQMARAKMSEATTVKETVPEAAPEGGATGPGEGIRPGVAIGAAGAAGQASQAGNAGKGAAIIAGPASAGQSRSQQPSPETPARPMHRRPTGMVPPPPPPPPDWTKRPSSRRSPPLPDAGAKAGDPDKTPPTSSRLRPVPGDKPQADANRDSEGGKRD
ncbi:MAG: serine/threonine protein kinase [Planctomycetota bacterium]|nr:serine/threonine protein kinase [Planctomycetota bacterium]